MSGGGDPKSQDVDEDLRLAKVYVCMMQLNSRVCEGSMSSAKASGSLKNITFTP